MKKAIVLINKPYILIQFLYLYNQFPDYEYDVVIIDCALNQSQGNALREKCETLGAFNKIIVSAASLQNICGMKKIGLFIQLLVLFILRKQSVFYRKILNRDGLDISKYDMIIVPHNFSFVSFAAIASCSENCEVIMLEEGTCDYISKYNFVPKKDLFRLKEWIGWSLCRMKYINLNWHYSSSMDTKIIKYCSQPSLLKYRKYKEIRKLFEFERDQKKFFQKQVYNIYSITQAEILHEIQAVIFTYPYTVDYCKGTEWFASCQNWLNSELKGQKVLIKKHPRDTFSYSFDNTETLELFAQIPGELIVTELDSAKIIFLFPSTILLNAMNRNLDYVVVFFQSISDSIYIKRFTEYCDVLNIPSEKIKYV